MSVPNFVRYEEVAGFPVRPDRFMLLAQIIFDSREDSDRALDSEARAEARADFPRFPRLEGAVYHQAAVMEEVLSR